MDITRKLYHFIIHTCKESIIVPYIKKDFEI